MTADTGAALAAAVAAYPDDDAPWLVYADWLQEAGRDAEAAALRAHLPALRDAVHNGHVVDIVLSAAVECPPPHPMWNLMFGLPAIGDPAGLTSEPAPPAPEPIPRPVDVPAGSRGDDPVWTPLIGLIVVVTLGAFRAVSTAPGPGVKPAPVYTRDWTPPELPPLHQQFQARAALRLPAPDCRWEQAEVAGHTFRRLSGAAGSQSFTFRANGKVVRNDGTGSPVERWTIGPDGDLQLIGIHSQVTARLVKLRRVEDVYDIECDGHTDLYIRQRP